MAPAHPSPAMIVAVLEHVLVRWMEAPEVALTVRGIFARHLDEALVQAQVVPDGVLPAALVLLKVRKPGHDGPVDVAQGESTLRGFLECHVDEGHVRVRGLARAVGPTARGTGLLRRCWFHGGQLAAVSSAWGRSGSAAPAHFKEPHEPVKLRITFY